MNQTTTNSITEKHAGTDPSFFRELCESLAFACIAVDSDLNVLFWNAQATEHLGKTADDMAGRSFLEAIEERDRDPVRQLLDATMKRGVAGEMEVKFGEGDDRRTWVLIASPIFDGAGQGCQAVSVSMRDISLRKRLSQELSKSHRIASLGKMAEGVAHYFNNILGCMQTSIECALPSESARDLRRALKLLLQSIARATRITNQLAAFAEAENRQVEYGEINSIVSQFVERLQASVKDPSLHVIPILTSVPPASVESQRIVSVLESLSRNAIEAMSGGGTLTIEMRHEDGHVVIVVRDTGSGMSEEALDHVFEPFYTTKGGRGGGANENIGLGLAAVHGLVSEMGGTIKLSSKLGEGTRAELRLPLRRKETECESASPPAIHTS